MEGRGTDSVTIALTAAADLFNRGLYLAAHEVLDDLWEQTQGPDADFFKGLIQASIALHHFQEGNLEGARRLQRGHRQFLGKYLPQHLGVDVAALLEDMRRCMAPLLRQDTAVPFPEHDRPVLSLQRGTDSR